MMPPGAAVRLHIRQLVDQQQVAYQAGDHHRQGQRRRWRPADRDQHGEVDHQQPETGPRRQQAEQGETIEPGRIADNQGHAQQAGNHDGRPLLPEKIQTRDDHHRQRHHTRVQSHRSEIAVAHQGATAAAERRSPGMEIQATAKVLVLVEGIDGDVGRQRRHQNQSRIQRVDSAAGAQGNRQGGGQHRWHQQQERRPDHSQQFADPGASHRRKNR